MLNVEELPFDEGILIYFNRTLISLYFGAKDLALLANIISLEEKIEKYLQLVTEYKIFSKILYKWLNEPTLTPYQPELQATYKNLLKTESILFQIAPSLGYFHQSLDV